MVENDYRGDLAGLRGFAQLNKYKHAHSRVRSEVFVVNKYASIASTPGCQGLTPRPSFRSATSVFFPLSPVEQREKAAKRKDDPTVAPTSFLWAAYHPNRYNFEVRL